MKIFAILLNPTIDQIYEIEDFYVGGTFKVKNTITYPVGKAISFSLGVRELIKDRDIVKVIAFIGKDEIPIYSNFLKTKNIEFEFVRVKGKTRSNKTINDPIRKTTTHIRERGFELEQNDLNEFERLLKENVNPGDFVVFSGSIPPNVDKNIYYKMIKFCNKVKATTILDSNGSALVRGIKASPNIIKPNLLELSQILKNSDLNKLNLSKISISRSIIVKEAKSLLNDELEIILITLGNKGALCLTKHKDFYGNVKLSNVIDTVGSGDSFLAGFVLNYFLKKDLQECFKYAIACGAANTLIPGPGIFSSNMVKKILERVEIIDLS
ncbi:MAG: 1-phosphofructokinase family hexose kinase [Promethearchaeota archaeon]